MTLVPTSSRPYSTLSQWKKSVTNELMACMDMNEQTEFYSGPRYDSSMLYRSFCCRFKRAEVPAWRLGHHVDCGGVIGRKQESSLDSCSERGRQHWPVISQDACSSDGAPEILETDRFCVRVGDRPHSPKRCSPYQIVCCAPQD